MLVVSGTGMTLLTFDLNRTFCYSIPRRPETLSLLVAIHCSHWQFKFSLMNVDSTLFSPTELHSVNFSNLCFAAEFIGLENYWETAIEHCVSISTHYWLFKFSKNVCWNLTPKNFLILTAFHLVHLINHLTTFANKKCSKHEDTDCR